jgi:hypothetical protein
MATQSNFQPQMYQKLKMKLENRKSLTCHFYFDEKKKLNKTKIIEDQKAKLRIEMQSAVKRKGRHTK